MRSHTVTIYEAVFKDEIYESTRTALSMAQGILE